MEITKSKLEVKAWVKEINLIHDGINYSVDLYWDEIDGYMTAWSEGDKRIPTPSWATKLDGEDENSLEFQLDELSDIFMEEK
jgi:hypothetical protein